MASKASPFVFGLLIICASIVIFTPEVVADTKYEGIEENAEATDKSQGRVLLVGALVKLLPKIFRIYEVYDKVNNAYTIVNWTSTQLYEHVDNQCFPYCRESTTTTNPCECVVSTQDEPPQVIPNDQQCKDFEYHCCDWTWIGLNCEQCCKGPRPAILDDAPSPAPALEP